MATKAQIKAIRTILARSREYDPDTMQITKRGEVSAKQDPNKVPRITKRLRLRYLVGYVSDMVEEDGTIREGF